MIFGTLNAYGGMYNCILRIVCLSMPLVTDVHRLQSWERTIRNVSSAIPVSQI